MWIYKVTNIINDKCYIGQTTRPVEERIRRHFLDASTNRLDTHFARAIRKYGCDNFVWEIIDQAESQEELTVKEQQWIRRYDSVHTGYNETDAIYKCGGNTYKGKSEDELRVISEKIKESKMGGKNPHAKSVRITDIQSGEIMIFNSQKECADALGLDSHHQISRMCRGVKTTPILNRYIAEYYNEKGASTSPDECKGVEQR